MKVESEGFEPMILVLDEGDRVWWDWSKRGVCDGFVLNQHCLNNFKHPERPLSLHLSS